MFRVMMVVLAGLAMLSGAEAAQENEAQLRDRRSLETELTPVTGEPLPRVNLYITFALGSSKLTEHAKRQLEELAAALNGAALNGATFGVYGHTDALGSDDYNLALSEERAASVTAFLVNSAGVRAERLSMRGYGETRLKYPLRPNDSANRRVEIVMLTPPDKTPDDDNGMTAIVR